MAESKYLTIMLVPEGTEAKFGFRIRRWLLKTIVITLAAILIGIILFFSFYGTILSRAARTEILQKENESLLRYRYKVALLEDNLNQARDVVSRLATMAGIDYEFPEFPSDSTLFAQLDYVDNAVLSRSHTTDWTTPEGLPVQGFITQEFVLREDDQYHPGIDIACAIGTPVLATGSGVVEFTGFDSVYGHLVVLRHNDSMTTIFGHNDQVLVHTGQQIAVGSRIALSGNSGQSTAPHVHYEIRVNDKPLNPLESIYEENKQR
ncbi:MAG: peptidoglycan DD-metalloendopeptidase family protein [Candidatus Zixiibacteriota bacterium]|nr:MAG: peptidoglycan DD-metalloendopeptidase family protein [candidate division Zixibacteria bacterium]